MLKKLSTQLNFQFSVALQQKCGELCSHFLKLVEAMAVQKMVVERPIVEGTLAERSINDGTVVEELAVEDLLNKKFDVDSLAVK